MAAVLSRRPSAYVLFVAICEPVLQIYAYRSIWRDEDSCHLVKFMVLVHIWRIEINENEDELDLCCS